MVMNRTWKRRFWILVLASLGLSPFLLWGNGVWADEPTLPKEEAVQKGVEVLTRGPIHEAFAEPLTVNPRPNPIIHRKPPAAIEEIPPDQKPEGTHIQWIPGYFAWDETGNDYIWISGLWRATPPGRQWMPGHWVAEGEGWQWVSGYWAADGQEEVEYLPPPPPSIDTGPSAEAPDADSLYTPGTWVYQDSRYLWRPGFWFRARPDWFYNPARYTYTPAGYIFSDGYWDYPLQSRGMLFAPARFSQGVWGTPGWNYQPRYAIGFQGLLNSLFVHPAYNRYYFGDYYGPGYSQQGFLPWFNYSPGRNTPDPLYSYSRWNSRADAQWEGNLRGLYKDRLAGTAARPPITLVQQTAFIHNVTVNKQVQIGNKIVNVEDPQSILQHLPVVTPLNAVDHGGFKLVPIPKTTAAVERKAAQHTAAVALERHKREAELASQGVHPARPNDPPARVKVVQPQGSTAPRVPHVKAPPAPAVPRHVAQPIPKHEPVRPIHVNPPARKGRSSQLHRERFNAAGEAVSAIENRHSLCLYAATTFIGSSGIRLIQRRSRLPGRMP
jgi:YXWGXW repeat-containing protein